MTVLDSTLVERVNAEPAGQPVNWGQLILLAIAGVFYSLGWVAGKVFNVMSRVGPALTWVGRAVRLGWRDARGAVPVRT